MINYSDDSVIAKLTDFGTAEYLEPGVSEIYRAEKNNPNWLSPESCRYSKYSFASDIYSYGMVLYELRSLQKPFYECNFWALAESAVIEGQRPVLPDPSPPEFTKLVRQCWEQEPNDRPSTAEIIHIVENLMEIREEIELNFGNDLREYLNSLIPKAEWKRPTLSNVQRSTKLPADHRRRGSFLSSSQISPPSSNMSSPSTTTNTTLSGSLDGNLVLHSLRRVSRTNSPQPSIERLRNIQKDLSRKVRIIELFSFTNFSLPRTINSHKLN